MSEIEIVLPEGAVPAATGGFDRQCGPLYRLPAVQGASLQRFCIIAQALHIDRRGNVHGATVLSFLEAAMDMACRFDDGGIAEMVSLACDFLAPARLGDVIVATVQITRQTHTMIFLSAEAQAKGCPVATASGIWKISQPSS